MEAGLRGVRHDSHAKVPKDEGDPAISAIAARQRGLITLRQLEAAGVHRGAIRHRVARGRLHPLYRGVYLVGHSLPVVLARQQGAVLACGRRAVLSHRSAAQLWRLPVQEPREVEITVAGRDVRQGGIRIYRVPDLHRRDIRRHKGLPLTAPSRTLLDLAAMVPAATLEQAVAEAIARRLVSRTALDEAIERAPLRHGSKALRSLLNREAPPAHTRSSPERLMLALVRRHCLPEPATNVQLEEWNVDFLWRDQGLVVELDTYGFHSSPAAWERDHEKESDLEDHGWTVRRVTKRQLEIHPDRIAERLRRWLEEA